MTAAILSIGTELVRGEVPNGNATWLAEQLTLLGHEVRQVCTIADDIEEIAHQLQRLLATNSIVVTTGGLGPTSDDLTRDAVAKLLQLPLERHPDEFRNLEARLSARGRTMSRSNARQVDFPRGAAVLSNALGTAPGFAVVSNESIAIFLPGVPREMRAMFESEVVPRLPPSNDMPTEQVVVRSFGLPESVVADMLQSIGDDRRVQLGYRVHFPDLDVKVVARHPSRDVAKQHALEGAAIVEARLGSEFAYARGQTSLPESVAQLLAERKQTLALAESCTGGLVATLLSAIPGASSYLLGGAITYANHAKSELAGVSPQVIDQEGAVSEEVALAMARGIRERLGSDLGVSLTGIAGPSGGSKHKPVGLVYCALADGNAARVRKFEFFGSRVEIQKRSAFSALALVRERLLEDERIHSS